MQVIVNNFDTTIFFDAVGEGEGKTVDCVGLGVGVGEVKIGDALGEGVGVA